MLSPLAKALARVRGGDQHAGRCARDLSPLPCPACGARIGADRSGSIWHCAGGHRYPTTRTLIAALTAAGWRPSLEVYVGSDTRYGSALSVAAADAEAAPA